MKQPARLRSISAESPQELAFELICYDGDALGDGAVVDGFGGNAVSRPIIPVFFHHVPPLAGGLFRQPLAGVPSAVRLECGSGGVLGEGRVIMQARREAVVEPFQLPPAALPPPRLPLHLGRLRSAQFQLHLLGQSVEHVLLVPRRAGHLPRLAQLLNLGDFALQIFGNEGCGVRREESFEGGPRGAFVVASAAANALPSIILRYIMLTPERARRIAAI
mmetsp:Transcript_56047/g.119194  ORF Transcript_56047/g.119194 Transcript_56047/m.119194 type:complete len:219 (+) Transcript_56047:1532-2188(+)